MKERRIECQKPHKSLSKRSRAALLRVNLSSCYVKAKLLSQCTVDVMNDIRDIYTDKSCKGYRRITWDLQDMGYRVNHKKVYRLMKLMGLQSVYPKKNLSKRRQADAIYSYLLKEHPPEAPHDVWCVDITYIRTAQGFVYLTALIDVVSRFVVGYSVSPYLDTESCLSALEMAINSGYKPKIINSDQGCQFTSQEWCYALSLLGIRISMDGKGRCLDNIPIERFWRTIKYEEVYLKTYETVAEAKEAIAAYIYWYNHERRHMGLNKHRPYEVMMGQENAAKWPFRRVAAYVDNCEGQLPHIYTTPTTKVSNMGNHSSKIAA